MTISPETWYNYLNFKTNGAGVISTDPALTKHGGIISMPAATDSTPSLRVCIKCKQSFPTTPEYFSRDKTRRDGLHPECKACNSAYNAAWRKANPDKSHSAVAAWKKANPDKKHAYDAAYRKANPEKVSAGKAAYRKANPERVSAGKAAWYKANSDKTRASSHRRLARERALPCNWTAQDGQHALDYFGGLCAYCGGQADSLFSGNHFDHFISLADIANCPGTVPTNMLPACQQCNLSKGASDPQEWTVRKFGKRKATKILANIEAFFKSLEVPK